MANCKVIYALYCDDLIKDCIEERNLPGTMFSCVGGRNMIGKYVTHAAVLLALFAAAPANAQTNQPRCTCEFADSSWHAYGTKAACAVYMHDGKKTCEVEFAGVSANPNLVSKATGQPIVQYDFGYAIGYFEVLAKRDITRLADPKLFVPQIKALMRGAYFRGEYNDRAATMDKILVSFFDKYTQQVSDVFLGKASAFKTEISGGQVEVGRGYITLDYASDRVTAVYFSLDPA